MINHCPAIQMVVETNQIFVGLIVAAKEGPKIKVIFVPIS